MKFKSTEAFYNNFFLTVSKIALLFINPLFSQSRIYLLCHSVSILRYANSTIFTNIR